MLIARRANARTGRSRIPCDGRIYAITRSPERRRRRRRVRFVSLFPTHPGVDLCARRVLCMCVCALCTCVLYGRRAMRIHAIWSGINLRIYCLLGVQTNECGRMSARAICNVARAHTLTRTYTCTQTQRAVPEFGRKSPPICVCASSFGGPRGVSECTSAHVRQPLRTCRRRRRRLRCWLLRGLMDESSKSDLSVI